jgi:two-component system sensor histidine kinase TctE
VTRILANSLSQRQLVIMVSALVGIAAILAVGGTVLAASYAERASDRVLRSAVNAISDTLTVEGDVIQGRVPAGAFSFLEDTGQDSVFYNISQGDRIITGYQELAVESPENAAGFAYRDDEVFGQKVRVASQAVELPRQAQPVVIQVAETLHHRESQTREMLFAVLVLELVLVLAVAAMIKPAVRWGLRPVERLQAQLSDERISPLVQAKLDTQAVPSELQGLVEAYNHLLAQLGDAVVAHRRFTGDASHQLRTPLTILKSHIAVLQQSDAGSVGFDQSLSDIAEASARLERLLSQLLKLARAEGGGVSDSAVVQTDLTHLIADLCRRLAPEALQHGMDIEFHAAGDTIIRTHPVVVEEIVGNLIDNAIRYNRPQGRIEVRVERGKHGPIIEVRDEGPGIAPQDRDRIFRRFSRLSRDSAKPGSGLGLAISRTLAEAVGANVEIAQSEAGRGSIFRVTFMKGW